MPKGSKKAKGTVKQSSPVVSDHSDSPISTIASLVDLGTPISDIRSEVGGLTPDIATLKNLGISAEIKTPDVVTFSNDFVNSEIVSKHTLTSSSEYAADAVATPAPAPAPVPCDPAALFAQFTSLMASMNMPMLNMNVLPTQLSGVARVSGYGDRQERGYGHPAAGASNPDEGESIRDERDYSPTVTRKFHHQPVPLLLVRGTAHE
jgi:hypothetical protein